ncbi:hypothetical protein SK128_001584 [Halocaridina rubra]|uniref:Secreted protein n=1 Tax=Halocaridina rubra TaxID=373956 RepID=A0AAN8X9S6_HALRR
MVGIKKLLSCLLCIGSGKAFVCPILTPLPVRDRCSLFSENERALILNIGSWKFVIVLFGEVHPMKAGIINRNTASSWSSE